MFIVNRMCCCVYETVNDQNDSIMAGAKEKTDAVSQTRSISYCAAAAAATFVDLLVHHPY